MQIPIYSPYLCGNEKKYVNDCLETSWISSKGKFISAFENDFSRYIGAFQAISVCNGTVAIHLALLALNIQPGDEIIVPTFTYVASVNTIVQVGATPVFVDSLVDTWQIDPEEVQKKITSKTRAVMAVHLYGHPCEMQPLIRLCKENGLYLIEDCAEAFGSYYQNTHVGLFGDVATFSFYGNKTLTTGEGGMVIVKDPVLHDWAGKLKNQGVSTVQYWHDSLGYNYRMTNICAAIGLAQLEKIDEILAKKRQIASWYKENLQELPLVTHEETVGTIHSYWMCSILLDETEKRDPLRAHLAAAQIETRPLFYPVHLFPMYQTLKKKFPIAESLGSRGMNLPSWPGLEEKQLKYITQKIREYF